MHVRKQNNSKESRLNRTEHQSDYIKLSICAIIFSLYYKKNCVAIIICLLLAEPLKRVFLTLTIICRNRAKNDSRYSNSITHIYTCMKKRNRLERYYKRMDTKQVIIYLHRKANHQRSSHLNTNLRTFNFIKYSLTLCCLKYLFPDSKI